MKSPISRARMLERWRHALLLVSRDAELLRDSLPATNCGSRLAYDLLIPGVLDPEELCDIPGQIQFLGAEEKKCAA